MTTFRQRFTKSVIAKKLILYVILFSSLITLIITALQLYYDYSQEIKMINNSLEQIESVHVGSLSASLWAVDTHNIRTQLDGILSIRDMEYLEVRENDSIWVAVGVLRSKNIIEKSFPLVHVTKGKPRRLGELHVVASLEGIYSRLIDKALTILVSNAIKTFLVSGFILILFYQMVTRHLIEISSFTESHDIDNPDQERLSLDREEAPSNAGDELSVVVSGLNKMREKISLSYQKIKEREEKYRQLVEMAQEGIWAIDKNAATTYVNPAMAGILGYSVDEMIGRHLFDFMDEQGKEIAAEKLRRRERGINENHDFEFLRKDGKRIYTTMAAAPLYDESGKYTGAIAGVLDITARKSTEDELRKNKQLLEKLVDERTRALQMSNKELEAFSYSVAHDLRTPLRSITSFGQILQQEANNNLSSDGQDALSRIIRAGKNMSALIDELLELSRISRTDIDYIPVDMTSLTEDIVAHLVTSNPGRKNKITIAPNMKAVADPTLIHVALQNLIQNAWKFSSQRDKTIIEIGHKVESGVPCFYIKDYGAGFDMKYQHKLFDAFQRLHGSEFSGSGIGLATVHRIIHRHGGKIWAEGVEGIGATFYFTLPDHHNEESEHAQVYSQRN